MVDRWGKTKQKTGVTRGCKFRFPQNPEIQQTSKVGCQKCNQTFFPFAWPWQKRIM